MKQEQEVFPFKSMAIKLQPRMKTSMHQSYISSLVQLTHTGTSSKHAVLKNVTNVGVFWFCFSHDRLCLRCETFKETGTVEDGFPGSEPSYKWSTGCKKVRRMFRVCLKCSLLFKTFVSASNYDLNKLSTNISNKSLNHLWCFYDRKDNLLIYALKPQIRITRCCNEQAAVAPSVTTTSFPQQVMTLTHGC